MYYSLPSHERSVIETMFKLTHSIHEIGHFLKRSPAIITYEINLIKPYTSQHAQGRPIEKRPKVV